LTTGASRPPAEAPASADFADPFVLRDGATYYAFGTGAAGRHLQVAKSDDLSAWSALPDALPVLPAWASRQPGFTWAPSVLRRGSTYALYYTARHASSDLQCISRATATRPEGPYVDASAQPFVCQVSGASSFCGSIDPSPFVDARGEAFLLWKSDENSDRCRGASRIWGQQLTTDGLDVVGAATALLTMDRPWERPLIEGPSMIASEGTYNLFYSANWYESARYAIGYATCATPLGPCKKMTLDGPLVQSSATKLGPGGQEFFEDVAGARWMAYHAWSAPAATYAAGGARSLRFARVTFDAGIPVVTER
jgi:beta-xylosidase